MPNKLIAQFVHTKLKSTELNIQSTFLRLIFRDCRMRSGTGIAFNPEKADVSTKLVGFIFKLVKENKR